MELIVKHNYITFFWRTWNSHNVIELKDCDIDEAISFAEKCGYSKPIWWKYWTYDNGFVYGKLTEYMKERFFG